VLIIQADNDGNVGVDRRNVDEATILGEFGVEFKLHWHATFARAIAVPFFGGLATIFRDTGVEGVMADLLTFLFSFTRINTGLDRAIGGFMASLATSILFATLTLLGRWWASIFRDTSIKGVPFDLFTFLFSFTRVDTFLGCRISRYMARFAAGIFFAIFALLGRRWASILLDTGSHAVMFDLVTFFHGFARIEAGLFGRFGGFMARLIAGILLWRLTIILGHTGFASSLGLLMAIILGATGSDAVIIDGLALLMAQLAAIFGAITVRGRFGIAAGRNFASRTGIRWDQGRGGPEQITQAPALAGGKAKEQTRCPCHKNQGQHHSGLAENRSDIVALYHFRFSYCVTTVMGRLSKVFWL
jgi:hypothetical protein